MNDKNSSITRRDFMRGAACAALGVALPLHLIADDESPVEKTRVVLVRHKDIIDADGNVNAKIAVEMLDDAVSILFDAEKPIDAWKQIIQPDDIVGVKSNEWGPLPTPVEFENAIRNRVMDIGVSKDKIDIDDRAVLHSKVFRNSTALINIRPLRTHHWSGIGSCIKNYVMFTPEPWTYHDNYCADLAKLWDLPVTKGKTRLNILVVLTPLFHGIGAHHFDKKYTWPYNGIIVSRDPVAADSVGLRLLHAKRLDYFGEDNPLKPTPHHVRFAETKHHLGIADPEKIDLVKIGWDEGMLI